MILRFQYCRHKKIILMGLTLLKLFIYFKISFKIMLHKIIIFSLSFIYLYSSNCFLLFSTFILFEIVFVGNKLSLKGYKFIALWVTLKDNNSKQSSILWTNNMNIDLHMNIIYLQILSLTYFRLWVRKWQNWWLFTCKQYQDLFF